MVALTRAGTRSSSNDEGSKSGRQGADAAPADTRRIVYEDVYARLFTDLITGQLEPGKALTVRGLAKQLNVSPMPVREAVKRLVAQGALAMTETRRVMVAPMTDERFREIGLGRSLLEPEIAATAMPHLSSQDIRRLEDLDAKLDRAIARGDTSSYGRYNWGFHAYIYQRANLPSLFALVESLWLQVGPFMRLAVGRYGTSNLEDQHRLAIQALKSNDETLLRAAIRQDILDGVELIRAEP